MVYVNTEDAILTGKVQYLNQNCALILTGNFLICRMFAERGESALIFVILSLAVWPVYLCSLTRPFSRFPSVCAPARSPPLCSQEQ